MTARDFTPTDEQVRDCAMYLFQADTGKEIPRVDEFAHYLGLARVVFATDAQKSIIAAAKAEALREFERRVYNGAPGKYQAFYNEGLSPELLIAAGEYERDEASE